MQRLSSESVHCCVTSPPYWGLRDYEACGQLGMEPTPVEYVQRLVDVFRSVRRVLRDDGTLWLNLGDTYAADRGGTTPPAQTVAGGVRGAGGTKERRGQATGYNPSRDCTKYGLKHKDLVGIPWRVALALQDDGWLLRQDIIWSKPNPMPESVRDRCTKAHEYVFLLTKGPQYFWDRDAAKDEGRRNRRSVWNVQPRGYKGAHFAVMPEDLVRPCILMGCPVGGTVMDPFTGSGTVGAVAIASGRSFIGFELNASYAEIARKRVADATSPLFSSIQDG